MSRTAKPRCPKCPSRTPNKIMCSKCKEKCDTRVAKYKRPKKITLTKLEKLQSFLRQIKKQKQKCSDDRDKLRGLVENINDIVESWEDASETLQNAVDELERGIDQMSEYI